MDSVQTDVSSDLSALIAAEIAGMRYEDIPSTLVQRAKLLLLDTLGVMAGAAKAPGVLELHRLLQQWHRGGCATSLVGGWNAAPDAAALANGVAAHALDFDDQHDAARVHTYCVALPAALAAMEQLENPDGKLFLAALITGVELHCRLGLACKNALSKGWHPTTELGHFAAAATAARALNLDRATTLSALGIASAQVSGSAQALFERSMMKRVGPGLAARSGVLAAGMAAAGITGPVKPFEGEAGFISLYERGEVDVELLAKSWGDRWESADISMKPYPCCRCSHSTIQVAIELRKRGIRPSDVKSATISLGKINHRAVGGTYDPARAANPSVHAQFNAAFSFAAALSVGSIDIPTFEAPTIFKTDLVELARRIKTQNDPEISENAVADVLVVVDLTDGTQTKIRRTTVKGSPQEPMTGEEIREKFTRCMEYGLHVAKQKSSEFADWVTQIDRASNVKNLVSHFADLQAQQAKGAAR
jgi:2-methylcitrate dehydratase PrpD